MIKTEKMQDTMRKYERHLMLIRYAIFMGCSTYERRTEK